MTRQASLPPLRWGIRVPGRQGPGVRRSPMTSRFPPGRGSGPPGGPEPSRWAEAPDVCVLGSPGAVTAPAQAGVGSEFAAVPAWGALWAGRRGKQGRACTPGVGWVTGVPAGGPGSPSGQRPMECDTACQTPPAQPRPIFLLRSACLGSRVNTKVLVSLLVSLQL